MLDNTLALWYTVYNEIATLPYLVRHLPPTYCVLP